MAFYSLHFRDYCYAIDFHIYRAPRIASGNFVVFEIMVISTNVILPFNFAIQSNLQYIQMLVLGLAQFRGRVEEGGKGMEYTSENDELVIRREGADCTQGKFIGRSFFCDA